jgi:hypothetical protein
VILLYVIYRALPGGSDRIVLYYWPRGQAYAIIRNYFGWFCHSRPQERSAAREPCWLRRAPPGSGKLHRPWESSAAREPSPVGGRAAASATPAASIPPLPRAASQIARRKKKTPCVHDMWGPLGSKGTFPKATTIQPNILLSISQQLTKATFSSHSETTSAFARQVWIALA